MTPIHFTPNHFPTIGVEIELQLVDAKTFELRSAINEVLERLPESARESVKPELMQSYLEINSGVCRTVAEVGEDLQAALNASGAHTIVLRNLSSPTPWVAAPLYIDKGDPTLRFEANAFLHAKRGRDCRRAGART